MCSDTRRMEVCDVMSGSVLWLKDVRDQGRVEQL